MPIYQNQMNYGLQGLQPGFNMMGEMIGQSLARRYSPEGMQNLADAEELTQYITPEGKISESTPRRHRKRLEDLMAQGKVGADPNHIGGLYIAGEEGALPEGYRPLQEGQFTFYDLWGPEWEANWDTDVQPNTLNMQTPEFQNLQMAQMMNPMLMERMRLNGGSPQFAPQQPQLPIGQNPGFQPQQPMMQQPQTNPLLQMLGYPTPGPIPTRKIGGPVPSGTSAMSALQQLMNLERDEVPIIAHEGEHVMTKEATNMLGQRNLDLLNQMAREMPRFKEGGRIPAWKFFERQSTTRGESEQPKSTTEDNSDRMSRTPKGTTTTTSNGRAVDDKKYLERQEQPAPDLTGGRRIQQAPMMDPNSNSIAGVNLGEYADRQGALTLMEIGRQVVEGLTSRGGPRPEGEYRASAGADPRPSTMTGMNQPQGSPDAISSAQPRNDYSRSRPMGGNGQPTSGMTVHQEKAVRPPQGQQQQQQQQKVDEIPVQPPKPPVNPPNKDEGTERSNRAAEPKEKDVTMERPYYRSPGAAPNVDWAKLSQLEPGQALTYLQQYAGAQGKAGILQRSPSGEDPRKEMFNDLAAHYANLKGIEDKVNEQKWRDMLMKGEEEKIKYELDRLKQISPYHADLTKAKLNLTNAQAYSALAQLLTSQEQTGHLMDMSPEDLLKMQKTSEEIKDIFINRVKDTKNSAYNVAKTQDDSTEAWKTYHEADIMHRMVTGTMSPEISWEDAKKQLGDKRSSFGKDKDSAAAVLDEASFNSARASANRILAKIEGVGSFGNIGSNIGGAAAPGGEVDINQLMTGIQALSQYFGPQ